MRLYTNKRIILLQNMKTIINLYIPYTIDTIELNKFVNSIERVFTDVCFSLTAHYFFKM